MSTKPLQLVILMPVRDDWESAIELVRRLDRTLKNLPCRAEVLLIDDFSLTTCPELVSEHLGSIWRIQILRLRRNLGHQRAIAIGLAYIEHSIPCEAVMVMDADGEDTPEGAARLVEVFLQDGGSRSVFAARSKRSESLMFRTFYKIYKAAHLALTGIPVRIGNFSILPWEHLRSIVTISDLWNHYAAAMVRSRIPLHMEPIPRGTRIAGKSSMNFVALVTHGLSAISVFSEIVGTRLIMLCGLGAFLSMVLLVCIAAIRLFTDMAIPGWASYMSGILILAALQFIAIALSFHFFLLSNRSAAGFLPTRDYGWFVDVVRQVWHA